MLCRSCWVEDHKYCCILKVYFKFRKFFFFLNIYLTVLKKFLFENMHLLLTIAIYLTFDSLTNFLSTRI